MFQACKGCQSVAVADCYSDRRDAYARMCKGKAYGDFRELLARKDIDAVVVATPDHWHVPIALAAARAGKDPYVEKPLEVTVEECLAARRVFAETGRVFQYGTQQRSSAHCRFGCELVRSGRIGKVHTLEVVAPEGGRTARPKWCRCRPTWITRCGAARRRSAPIPPTAASRRERIGSTTTPSVISAAGVRIPWTSWCGAAMRTSPFP